VKVGDLIFWHGRNTIALVISVDSEKNWSHENLWACLLEEDGMIINDDLGEGYTVIDENWDWPRWHINHTGDPYENR
jgi:hypothetical protein